MVLHALPANHLDVAMITALETVLGLAELYAFDGSSLHPGQHVFHLQPDPRQHVPTQCLVLYTWLIMWCTGRPHDWGAGTIWSTYGTQLAADMHSADSDCSMW